MTMTATQDRPAAVDAESVAVQRDWLHGLFIDREVSSRIARYVAQHGRTPRYDEREGWEAQARHKLAAALAGVTAGDYFVQLAREEL